MILNLRGTNGSGKSTVALALLNEYRADKPSLPLAMYTTPKGAERYVEGYHIKKLDLIIVGAYKTACGGCDGIKTQDLICSAVRAAFSDANNVFFEGVIVSTLFSRYHALARELGSKSPQGRFCWAYLDTPLETCLTRIQARNGGKEIKENLVASKVRAIASTRAKAEAAGEWVETIDHQDAIRAVKRLLKKGRP